MAQVSVGGTTASFAKCLLSHVRRVALTDESEEIIADHDIVSQKPHSNLIKVRPTLYQSPWQLDLSPDVNRGIPFQHNAPCPALAAEALCAHTSTTGSTVATSSTEASSTTYTAEKERKEKRTTVRVGVCVLIESADNQVLLTQRSKKLRSFGGQWVLPGGNLDPNETLVEAGARELFEETGLLLDDEQRCLLRPLCMWESTWPDSPARLPITHHHVVVYMHIRVSDTAQKLQLGLVLQPEEVAASAWIPREGVPNFISLTPSFHQLGKPDSFRTHSPSGAATELDESREPTSAGSKVSGAAAVPSSCNDTLDNVIIVETDVGEVIDVLTVVHVDGEVIRCSVCDVAAESPSGTTFVLDQWLAQVVNVRAGL